MIMPTKTERVATAAGLWVVLARAHNSLASFVEHSVAREGIGLSDFMVLEVLLHKGCMNISEIGEKVLLAAPSMTSAIDRLERLEYVIRKNSKQDRRIRLVELTAEGRGFIEGLYKRHERSLEEITQVLPQTERDQLRKLLKKWGLAVASIVEEQGRIEPATQKKQNSRRKDVSK
jgi:MarR family 2-MHQ and catechol resistance regulon transcriptional repressor